jgi:AraC family transcriptional activator FtrA
MTSVALAIADGISLLQVATPYEVFGTDRSELADPWYDFTICGPRTARIGGSFRIDAPRSFRRGPWRTWPARRT